MLDVIFLVIWRPRFLRKLVQEVDEEAKGLDWGGVVSSVRHSVSYRADAWESGVGINEDEGQESEKRRLNNDDGDGTGTAAQERKRDTMPRNENVRCKLMFMDRRLTHDRLGWTSPHSPSSFPYATTCHECFRSTSTTATILLAQLEDMRSSTHRTQT
jgi:hypothetical protein